MAQHPFSWLGAILINARSSISREFRRPPRLSQCSTALQGRASADDRSRAAAKRSGAALMKNLWPDLVARSAHDAARRLERVGGLDHEMAR